MAVVRAQASECARSQPRIDPAKLTVEVREIMKQPRSFAPTWREIMSFPMRSRLAETTPPCLLMGARADIFFRCLSEASGTRQAAQTLEIADNHEARAKAIMAFAKAARQA